MITGLNISATGLGYFSQCWPFNDMMKTASASTVSDGGGWTGLAAAYCDSNLWIQNAPNGTNVYTHLHDAVAADPLDTYRALRTGNYVVKGWTSGWTVTLEGTSGMCSEVLNDQANKRYVLNISNGKSILDCRVINNSGSAKSLTACKICHVDDEAALNAVTLFQSDFIDAHKNAQILRFMDLVNTNTPGAASVEWTSVRTEAARTYGNPAVGETGLPPSLMAKMCAAVSADMWLSVSVVWTRDCMRRAAAAIAAVSAFTGKIYVEFGNECWLFTDTRAYLRDTLGKGLDTDGDGQTIILYNFSDGAVVAAKGDTVAYDAESDNQKVSNAMGVGMVRLWDAFETAASYGAVPGRSRVQRMHTGQAASFGANQAALWQYMPDGTTRLKDAIDGGGMAPYILPAVTAAIPDVTIDGLIRANAQNNTVAEWRDSYKAYTTAFILGWVDSYRSSLATMSPQAALHTYECGADQALTLLSSGSYLAYTLDAVSNSFDFGLSIATAFTDGEQVHLSGGYSTPSSTLSAQGRYYVKKNGANKLWVFATQASYLADSGGDHAAPMDQAAGTRYAINFTRLEAIDTKIKTMLDGDEGRELYEDYKARVFDGKVSSFVHYADMGGHWLGAHWDLKNTQFSTDTPVMTWFRSLNPVATVSSGLIEKAILSEPAGGGGLISPRFTSLTHTKRFPGMREVIEKDDERIYKALMEAVTSETIH